MYAVNIGAKIGDIHLSHCLIWCSRGSYGSDYPDDSYKTGLSVAFSECVTGLSLITFGSFINQTEEQAYKNKEVVRYKLE